MEPTIRQYIRNLAMKMQGVPYIWGGEHPWNGFDCSGFVIWVLQVFEVLPSGDWTADMLYDTFATTPDPKPGDLCFYGRVDRGDYIVTHVMMYIGHLDGYPYCVGASGGDSDCKTREDALQMNAMVKLKPVQYRKDFLGYCSIDTRK